MVDISLDLQNDPERAEAIELLRGWVTTYLVASREHATSEDLSAYIATNALRLTDRSHVVTVKVLLHGLDYAAQSIRHLLGMCAYGSAERDGENPQDVELFAELRQGIWDGTRGFDRFDRTHH
jgi:hypothetical protein